MRKSRRIKWALPVACMGEKRDEFRILLESQKAWIIGGRIILK
jgi:hypothetical protein